MFRGLIKIEGKHVVAAAVCIFAAGLLFGTGFHVAQKFLDERPEK